MIKLDIDLSVFESMAQNLKVDIEKQSQEGAKFLAVATYNKILELANAQLGSTKTKYLEALSLTQEDDMTWFITLDKSAVWIDDGIPENTPMATSSWLLKPGKTKTSKEGHEYRSIPMQNDKASKTPASATVVAIQNAVKKELDKRKIPVKRIEKDANGVPKSGLLHQFRIKSKANLGDRPGADGASGFSAMTRVYQKTIKNKQGKEVTQRSVMTFRTVSSKYESSKWIYPGYQAKHFMEQAFAYGMQLVSQIGGDAVDRAEMSSAPTTSPSSDS